jgi:hypothetical protein
MAESQSALARAADELQQREFTRLAAAVAPSLEALRSLSGRQLRAHVATMLDRLGYELLTPETAADVVAAKDGKKYLVAFAADLDLAPTHTNHLTRLHGAVIAANAAGGFFITPRAFTRDAEAYAATAPLKLVDGPKLAASIKRSMEGIAVPDTYQAMCRICGEKVIHRLDQREAIQCGNGHPVAPTIAKAVLAGRHQDGSTSATYTAPRPYTRREVYAHNSKYIARMRKRKRAQPSEPAAPEIAPDPLASD